MRAAGLHQKTSGGDTSVSDPERDKQNPLERLMIKCDAVIEETEAEVAGRLRGSAV